MAKSLQPFIYSIVRRLFDQRKADKVFPYVATERAIIDDMRNYIHESLEEMVSDGLLKQTSNVNGIKMYAPANEDVTELIKK